MIYRGLRTKYGHLPFSVAFVGDKPAAGIFTTLEMVEISPPPDETTKKKKNGGIPAILRPGTIMISRRDPKTGEKKWQLFSSGIFAALRACCQINIQYHDPRFGEITQLQEAHTALHYLVCFLLANYPRLTIQEQHKIKGELDGLETKFSQTLNPFKRSAVEKIGKASGLQDSRHRRNPGATNARLTAAGDRFRARLREIAEIDPYVALRQLILLKEINRVNGIFAKIYPVLLDIAEKGGKDVSGCGLKMTKCIGELQSIHVGPFPAPVNRMIAEIKQAKIFFANGEESQGSTLLRRALQSMRCKKAQIILNDILVRFELWAQQEKKSEETCLLMRQSIEDELRDFLTRLQTIDETGFTKPVKAKVQAYITKALVLMQQKDKLGEAKELLRRAVMTI